MHINDRIEKRSARAGTRTRVGSMATTHRTPRPLALYRWPTQLSHSYRLAQSTENYSIACAHIRRRARVYREEIAYSNLEAV